MGQTSVGSHYGHFNGVLVWINDCNGFSIIQHFLALREGFGRN